MGNYRVAVTGESHVNRDGSSRQAELRRCRAGEPVTLVREPDNPHDPDAIAVLSTRGVQIGYVSRQASWVAGRIDRGDAARARIDSINGGDAGMLGAVLWLETDAEAMAPAADIPPPLRPAPRRPLTQPVPVGWSFDSMFPKGPSRVWGIIAVAFVALLIVSAITKPPNIPPADARVTAASVARDDAAAATAAAAAARFAQCQQHLARARLVTPLEQTADNRLEIDDRLWNEMDARTKRGLAVTFACVAYRGQNMADLPTMTYVVIYGSRSGRRLAQASASGVSLE